MRQTGPISVVITDTSILINLGHTGHTHLLGGTPGFRFLVSDEVLAEIADPEQSGIVETTVAEGAAEKTSIESPEELAIYAKLTQILGSGESACLALASSCGWLVACDEKRVFLREAQSRIGEGRLLNTPGLYVLWIRRGLLTLVEAHAAKLTLEAKRFKMAFTSFLERSNDE